MSFNELKFEINKKNPFSAYKFVFQRNNGKKLRDCSTTLGFFMPSRSMSSFSFWPGVCLSFGFWLLPFCCFLNDSRLGASCTSVRVAEKTSVCLRALLRSILSSKSLSSWKWPRSIIRSASSITKHLEKIIRITNNLQEKEFFILNVACLWKILLLKFGNHKLNFQLTKNI